LSRRNSGGVDRGEPVIGLLTVELHFPHSQSLKEKRMVVKAIKDRSRFNASVAEIGYQELWQRAQLSAVSVSSERRGLQSLLEAMAREVEERYPSELVEVAIEFID